MSVTFQEIMDFASVNKENYELLKQQIERNEVIPFVGAGLSACIYPGWVGVLKNLQERLWILL